MGPVDDVPAEPFQAGAAAKSISSYAPPVCIRG
jgi:hypothetical protein